MHILEDQEALEALEALEIQNHQSCPFLVRNKQKTKQQTQPITNFPEKIIVKPKLEVLP